MELSLIISLFLLDKIVEMIFPEFTLPERIFGRLRYFKDFLHGGLFKVGLIEAEDAFIIGFELPGDVEIGLGKVHDIHGWVYA